MTFRATFAAGLMACALAIPQPAHANWWDDVVDGAVAVKERIFGEPKNTTEVKALVTEIARQEGVPSRIAHAIIKKESSYNCRAKNPHSTAAGAGQLIKATAKAMGVRDVYNCRQNIRGSMRYLRKAIAKGGAGCAGVSLYQTGTGARPRCTAYGRHVMRLAAA